MTADHDPLPSRVARRSLPRYRVLRDSAPVHWAPSTSACCVSRYDDVMFVLRNPELFSSRAMFTFLMNQGHEGGRRSPGRSALPRALRLAGAAQPVRVRDRPQPDRRGRRAAHRHARHREPRLHAAAHRAPGRRARGSSWPAAWRSSARAGPSISSRTSRSRCPVSDHRRDARRRARAPARLQALVRQHDRRQRTDPAARIPSSRASSTRSSSCSPTCAGSPRSAGARPPTTW